jgi:hypothetical protein
LKAEQEVLPGDFFHKFLTLKLTAYISIYAEHEANTPGFTLRECLLQELESRKVRRSIINNQAKKKRNHQSMSCVIPYTSSIWNRFKLQRVLKNGFIKSALALDSVLGKRKLVVFHKYDMMLRQQICNYTAITKSTNTNPDTFPCYCDNGAYKELVNPHHKHILTCNMELLTYDKHAGDFLQLGTKYRNRYCPDNRPDRTVLVHALAYLRDRAMLIDGMPKEAYLHWMHEILHYYDTISVDEELSDAVTTTDNEHKQLLTASIQKLGRQFIITITDKAAGCYASAGI